MGKLEIRFSTAEMLLITSLMKIASFPNLGLRGRTYSNDELKTMLIAARDSLLARGLVRVKGQDGQELLDLHPIVKAAVGVTARPEKGWWLTITGGQQEPRNIFFSWTARLVISNWVTQEGVFCFEQVERDTLSSEILKFSAANIGTGANAQEAIGTQALFQVPVALLNAVVQNSKVSSRELSQLTQSGMSESDAQQLLEGLISPLERCILIGVSHLREEPQNVGLLIWFIIHGQTWLMEHAPDREDMAVLKKTSSEGVLGAITALVEKTIQSQ